MNPWPGTPLTRRDLFCRLGGGFGALGLASVLADGGLLAAEAEVPADPLAPQAAALPGAGPSGSSSCS